MSVEYAHNFGGYMADLVEAQFTRQRKTLAEAMAAGGAMQLQPTQHCMTSDDDALIYRGTESFGSVFRRTLSYPISLTTDLVGQIPIMGADKSIVFSTGTRSAGKFLAYDGTWQTPAGGGESTTTLQGAYNNSIEPEIVTNNSLGALSLANGQTLDTANQLEVKRLAGDITASIDGNGEIRVKNYNEEGLFPLMTAKVGIDPCYNPYIYFGADLGTTTRRGMSIGNGVLLISSDEIADLTISKKVSNGKNSIIDMSQDEKIYHSTQSDTISWIGDGRHNFSGSVGITNNYGGTSDILIDPATGVNLKSGLLYKINGVQHAHDNGIAYTGFDNPDNVTSSYNNATGVITLSGTAIMYYRGVAILDLKLGNHVSVARPTLTTNGLYYYYYNGTAFEWSTTPWLFEYAQIAIVYKSATAEFGMAEHHGCMPWETHRRLHETLGTSKISGGVSSGIVTGSFTATERRPAYTASVIRDEDLTINIPLSAVGNYAQLSVKPGDPTVSEHIYGQAEIVSVIGTIPRVNNPTTGNWNALSNSQYMNIFVIEQPVTSDANSQLYRRLFLNGQLASTTRATIDGQALSTLNLGDISKTSQEFVFTHRILIRLNPAGTDWSIISVNELSGTKVSQVSSPVSGSVALPSLVTGGLGLIPVGTTASGHTVFDNLKYSSTTGLFSGSSTDTALTVHSDQKTAELSSLIVFSALDSADAVQTYASAGAEIVDNTATSEDGAFVIKTMTGGVLSEQARFVGGKVNIGTATTSNATLTVGNNTSKWRNWESCIVAKDTSSLNFSLIGMDSGTNGAAFFIHDTNGLGFFTNATSGNILSTDRRMTISNGGKVGIGSLPTAGDALYVNGQATFAGNLAVGGTPRYKGSFYGTGSQLHLSSTDADSGAYFTSNGGSSCNLSAGVLFNGTAYIAKTTSANSTIGLGGGSLYVYYHNATTVGATSAAVQIAQFSSVGLAITGYVSASSTHGIYLTGAGAPTIAGEFAHDTTQKAFVNFANGLKGWMPREIYKMYGSVSVTNATGVTTLFGGTAVGSYSLPTNSFLAGKTYHIKCGGAYSRTANDQFTIDVYYRVPGTDYNLSASAFVSDNSTNAGVWSLEMVIMAVSATAVRSTFTVTDTTGGVFSSTSNGTLNQTTSASAGTLTAIVNGVASTTTVTCSYATITEC